MDDFRDDLLSALEASPRLQSGPLKGIREKWTAVMKRGTLRLRHSGGCWLIPGKPKQPPRLISKPERDTEPGSWEIQDADTWDQRVLLSSPEDAFLTSSEPLEMNRKLSNKSTWRFESANGAPDYPDGYGDGYGNADGLNNGVRGFDGLKSGVYAILDNYGRYLGNPSGLRTAALMKPRDCFKWQLQMVAPHGKVSS